MDLSKENLTLEQKLLIEVQRLNDVIELLLNKAELIHHYKTDEPYLNIDYLDFTNAMLLANFERTSEMIYQHEMAYKKKQEERNESI